MEANYDDSVNRVTKIATKISLALGLFPYQMELPVLK